MYLRSRVVLRSLSSSSQLSITEGHGAEAPVCGVGEEAQAGHLLLDLPLRLFVVCRRLVIVEDVDVAQGGKEGLLFGLSMLQVLPLEVLLVEALLGLGIGLILLLVLAGVVLVGGPLVAIVLGGVVVVLLGAAGDEVIGITALKATSLGASTSSAVEMVVVEAGELADDQSQLVISKHLQLLICHTHK